MVVRRKGSWALAGALALVGVGGVCGPTWLLVLSGVAVLVFLGSVAVAGVALAATVDAELSQPAEELPAIWEPA